MVFLRWGLVLSLALSALPQQALADDTAEARQLFKDGAAMAAEERWSEALELFRRSRRLKERPATVFNIASVLVRLGRSGEALTTIDEFLAMADPEADAEQIAAAKELKKTVLSTRAVLQLTVEPADAEILVDGEATSETGAERQLVVDPGSHRIQVRAEGYVTYRTEVSVLAGESLTRTVSLSTQEARLAVMSDVSGARIEVDGEVVGQGRAELTLAPGPHRVRVLAEGRSPFEREVELEAGGRLELDASLDKPLTKKPLFWVLIGTALVGGVIATLYGTDVLPAEADPYGGTAGFTLRALRQR